VLVYHLESEMAKKQPSKGGERKRVTPKKPVAKTTGPRKRPTPKKDEKAPSKASTAKKKTTAGTAKKKPATTKKTTTRKPVAKKTTAKKPTKKAPVKQEPAKKVEVVSKAPVRRTKKKVKEEIKYVRLSQNATTAKYQAMGERVRNGEVEWAFYAIDGNLGYHYYKVK
jgi:hypothetical protein